MAEDLGERLDARDLIHRRADDREVEPIAAADVAECDLPDVKGEAGGEAIDAFGEAFGRNCGEARLRLACSVDGFARGAAGVHPVFEWKNGDHAVADHL